MLNCMEMDLEPSTFECDPGGRMRHFHLMKHFQEIAARHAERNGYGMDWMIRNGRTWVLVDMRIGIERMPRWKESCTLYTMPSGYDRLRAFREFIVTDEKGREILKGSSIWMVLGLREKKPLPSDDMNYNFPEKGKKTYGDIRRSGIPQDLKPLQRIEVGESSIDLNGHVNNTEYVRWAVDAIMKGNFEKKSLMNILMSYRAEVFKGDVLDILSGHTDENRIIAIKREGTEKPVFTMELIGSSRE